MRLPQRLLSGKLISHACSSPARENRSNMKFLPFLLIAATAHASSPPQQYNFVRQGAQYVKLPYGIDNPCNGKIPLEDGKAKLYQNLHDRSDRRGSSPYPGDKPAPVYFLSEASVCKDGKRDGLATRYSFKNKIASESWYRASELHGTQKYFHENGKLRHETSFKNGKRHGADAEYAEDGTVISRVEYAEGTPSGPQFYYNVQTKVSRTQNFVNGNAQGEPEYQSKFTQELLIMAAGAGHLKTVERMLDRGAKPNEPGETEYTSQNAVIAAARSSTTEVLERLVSRGGDVNAYDRYRSLTPLIAAADLGKTDAVRVLLAKGANPNLRGHEQTTALIEATKYGRVQVVELLLAGGADPSLKDKDGRTAAALAEKHAAKAELLALLNGKKSPAAAIDQRRREKCIEESAYLSQIAVGPPERLTGFFEKCPLAEVPRKGLDEAMISMARYGRTELLKMFIEKGASLSATEGQWNETALLLAARNSHAETVKLLLERGADENAQDMHGYTPLMRATYNGDAVVVKLLLRHGAKAALKNKDGRTALELARQKKDAALEELLKNAQ
jgi:uncharacterized protein